MTKPIIPPQDPTRLARMQNEKLRMFGVDKEALGRQVQEARERRERERAEERAAAAAAAAANCAASQLADAASRARKAYEHGLDQFHRSQEDERRRHVAQWRQADAAASAAEQGAALASPWLNEAPETAVSALAPHRVRPDHFKGLSPQQRTDILHSQAAQAAANRAAAECAAAAAAAADARAAAQLAAANRLAAEAEAARRAAAGEVASMQQRQAVEARRRQSELCAHLNSQQPREEYFSQWGTSHR